MSKIKVKTGSYMVSLADVYSRIAILEEVQKKQISERDFHITIDFMFDVEHNAISEEDSKKEYEVIGCLDNGNFLIVTSVADTTNTVIRNRNILLTINTGDLKPVYRAFTIEEAKELITGEGISTKWTVKDFEQAEKKTAKNNYIVQVTASTGTRDRDEEYEDVVIRDVTEPELLMGLEKYIASGSKINFVQRIELKEISCVETKASLVPFVKIANKQKPDFSLN